MANLRYEMVSEYLRAEVRNLRELSVLELDPGSPLKRCLSEARTYIRTCYTDSIPFGTMGPDGSRCEDVTQLTFTDESFDLIISCDVLEHVPDVWAAFRETRRVLRPGGSHVFTVPTAERTVQRARIEDSEIRHLVEPEYHLDPLNPGGILAFWTFGSDAAEYFSPPGIELSIVAGPRGKDRRVLWRAIRTE